MRFLNVVLWVFLLPPLWGCADESVRNIAVPAPVGSAQPHLVRDSQGHAVLSWLHTEADQTRLQFATFDGVTWQTPITVAQGPDWLRNWADFPALVPVSEEVWYAHWLTRLPGGKYAYHVQVACSSDGGRTWSQPQRLHDDASAVEHGFVSMVADGDAGVVALWLDGRNTGSEANGAEMQLRSRRLAVSGAVSEEGLVDARVCDCCQTDMTLTSSGPVAVYRDRAVNEVRDIVVARLLDGTWVSQPLATDGWVIRGCPVNGPAIAARGDLLAVAWFTAADEPLVKVAISQDGGANFGAPVVVAAAGPLGRVDIDWLDGDRAVVSWLQGGEGQLQLRTVGMAGHLGPVHTVASMATERRAGFPQMLALESGLMLVWVETSADKSRLQAAWLHGL